MARRKDHSREELHAMALNAAEKIVATEGLIGLSTRKIAAAIGYAVGTLYLVFENLDDLILQVNARTLDDMYAFVTAAHEKCEAPDTCVAALGQSYLAFAQANPHRWRAIFEYQRALDPQIPEWFQKKVIRLFGLVEQPLQDLMPNSTQAVAAHHARVLWGSVHGICILGLSHKLDVVGAAAMQEMLDTLIKMYLSGLEHAKKAKKA